MMQPQRVLALDCDSDALINLERALENAGFSTTTTWHVPEALALLERGGFQVFLVRSHPQIDTEAIRAENRDKGGGCELVTLEHMRDHKNIVELLSARSSNLQRPVPRVVRKSA
jgi:DNA-binding NtrC family response regulator